MYCAPPSGIMNVPGSSNPVSTQQARMGSTSCGEAKRLVQSLLEEQVLVTFDIKSNDLHCIA